MCRHRYFFNILGVIIYLVFSGCAVDHPAVGNRVCFKEECVSVEVVSKEDDMRRGLQNRTSLAENSGMLFIFTDNRPHAFWMKDTLIPLDMIWMDHARRVVYIAQDVPPCKEDPCPSFGTSRDALYVLEINAGKSRKLNIQVGVQAEFHLNDFLQEVQRKS